MMEKPFSDLPELSVQTITRRPPPPPIPSQTTRPARPILLPLRAPSLARDNSHLSIESQQSRTSPRSASSSRTSLGTHDPRRPKYINIGIDFGTTFSGVSWAISGSQTVHTIDQWPEGDHVKVPTVLAYGPGGAVQWGYAIKPGLEKLKWFKLLLAENHLDESVRKSHHLQAAKALLKRLGKAVEDVTADYLQRLWEHAISAIKRDISNSIDGMPFRIVVGMPANWPPEAQKKMRYAAAKARILDRRFGLETVLEFVAEPEAAAVAAFYEGNIQHDVEIGDTIVICDAGGGTVDIAAYEVTRIKPSVTLSESISGSMALCGSIFLDMNFIKYMEGLAGKDKLQKLPNADSDELMEIWEHKIKRQYGTNRDEIAIRVPHSVAKVVDRPLKKIFRKGPGGKQVTGDVMRFSSTGIQDIFNPVIEEILALSLEQRNEAMKKRSKEPKAILLVGGLGGNKYLYERLQTGFSSGDISVLQPSGANVWASICRGAAIKSMGYDEINDDLPFPVVTSYISKAHYGMAFKEPYDSSRHTKDDRVEFDEAEQMELAWDQMSWYVKKGDDVSKGDPVEMTWEFKQPESRTRRDYTVIIFECTATDAPTRKTDEVRECAAITFTAAGHNMVYQDGNEGRQQFRIVRFDVRMSLCGMGKVDFALYVNGRLAASRDVRVVDGGGGHRRRS